MSDRPPGPIGWTESAEWAARAGEDVRDTLRVLRQLAGPAFTLDRVLHLGCGTGDRTTALARVAHYVVGVDESEATLETARQAAERAGVRNVEFVLQRPGLEGVDQRFDVLYSLNALERIPIAVGYPLIEAALDHVTARGGGLLQMPYGVGGGARPSSKLAQRLMRRASDSVVSSYDLNRVMALLHARRFDRVAVRFSDAEGSPSIKLFFWRGY